MPLHPFTALCFAPADVARIVSLEVEWLAAVDAALRAYEADAPDAEELDVAAVRLQERFESLVDALFESEDSDPMETSIEEEFVNAFHRFMQGDLPEVHNTLRSIINGHCLLPDASDAMLIDAARDAYEQRRELLQRYVSRGDEQ